MNERIRGQLLLFAGGVCSLAFLLPNHYSPWLNSHQEFGVALALLPLLVWAIWGGCHVMPPLAWGAVALALVPLLQIALGKLYFDGDGWMGVLYLLGFAFAVHAGSVVVSKDVSDKAVALERLIPILGGILVAGIVSVAIAAHQWLMLERLSVFVVDMPLGGRPFANFAQPNHLASLLLMAIAGLIFIWESGKLQSFSALVTALLLVFGIVMTGSRSVFITLVWLVPAYVLLRRRCRLRTSPLAFASMLGFYLIATISWPAVNSALLLGDSVSTAVDRMANPGIRSVFWISMLDAIGRAPWTGYGWGQIGLAQTVTALDYPATHSFFDSSHNLFLDLALWNGVPVAVLVTLGLLGWMAGQIRQCQDSRAWALLIAIGAIFSHAMVEYPLNYAFFLLPVGILMGALTAIHPVSFVWLSPSRWKGLRWVMRLAVPMLGGAALLLFVATVKEYLPYEGDWRDMRFREARIGTAISPVVRDGLVLTQLSAFMQGSTLQAAPGMPLQAVMLMRKLSERYAYPAIMYRYAIVQALNSDTLGAQQTLRRLCKMQTKSACRDAQNQWASLTHLLYPGSPVVAFPVIEVESEP